jgi:hypothetical protein
MEPWINVSLKSPLSPGPSGPCVPHRSSASYEISLVHPFPDSHHACPMYALPLPSLQQSWLGEQGDSALLPAEWMKLQEVSLQLQGP